MYLPPQHPNTISHTLANGRVHVDGRTANAQRFGHSFPHRRMPQALQVYVHDDPDGPEVAALVVHAVQHLGRDVCPHAHTAKRGAKRVSMTLGSSTRRRKGALLTVGGTDARGHVLGILLKARQAEVDDLELRVLRLRLEQKVLRLEVPGQPHTDAVSVC